MAAQRCRSDFAWHCQIATCANMLTKIAAWGATNMGKFWSIIEMSSTLVVFKLLSGSLLASLSTVAAIVYLVAIVFHQDKQELKELKQNSDEDRNGSTVQPIEEQRQPAPTQLGNVLRWFAVIG